MGGGMEGGDGEKTVAPVAQTRKTQTKLKYSSGCEFAALYSSLAPRMRVCHVLCCGCRRRVQVGFVLTHAYSLLVRWPIFFWIG